MTPRGTSQPADFQVEAALARLGLVVACVLTADAFLTLLTGSPILVANALWRHGFGNQLAQSLSIMTVGALGIALAGAALRSRRVLRAARLWSWLLAVVVIATIVTHVADMAELERFVSTAQHARLRGIDAKVITQLILGVAVLGFVGYTAGRWSTLLHTGLPTPDGEAVKPVAA